jgi:hypothetical protein
MSKKFEALPNQILLVEEMERLTEAKSIDEVTPVSVIQELGLVSSFLILKEETLYALGFDEDEEHWVIIGTFDELRPAVMSANQWVQNHYDDAAEMEFDEADFERAKSLLDE